MTKVEAVEYLVPMATWNTLRTWQGQAFAGEAIRVVIADDHLLIELDRPSESIEEARERAEAAFEPWRMLFELRYQETLQLEYSAAIVRDDGGRPDRIPAPQRSVSPWSDWAYATTDAPPEPPWPPRSSGPVGGLARSLWHRWTHPPDDALHLSALVYRGLTDIEGAFGGRRQAAQTLSVDFSVLGEMGRLSLIGRKAEESREHTDDERRFLRACMLAVAARVAEVEDGVQDLRRITLDDLPRVKAGP